MCVCINVCVCVWFLTSYYFSSLTFFPFLNLCLSHHISPFFLLSPLLVILFYFNVPLFPLSQFLIHSILLLNSSLFSSLFLPFNRSFYSLLLHLPSSILVHFCLSPFVSFIFKTITVFFFHFFLVVFLSPSQCLISCLTCELRRHAPVN